MIYEFEALTVRDLDFKDQSGKPVQGMQLWVVSESQEPGWNGYEVAKLWFPSGHRCESDVASLKHGDHVEVTFDRRGKPSAVKLVY